MASKVLYHGFINTQHFVEYDKINETIIFHIIQRRNLAHFVSYCEVLVVSKAHVSSDFKESVLAHGIVYPGQVGRTNNGVPRVRYGMLRLKRYIKSFELLFSET